MKKTESSHGRLGLDFILSTILGALLTVASVRAQVNTEYLRHDSQMGSDQVSLVFSDSCSPGADTRVMGLGIDQIRFIDADEQELFVIDVGNPEDRHWLDQGWYGDETWNPTLTVCWTQGLADNTTFHCRIPPTARFMDIVATIPPCLSLITTQVTVNGVSVGSFVLDGSTNWMPQRVALPDPVFDIAMFRLENGGPLALANIDWIDAQGYLSESDPLNFNMNTAGDATTLSLQVPSDAGDFQVTLASPAPTTSTLIMSFNGLSDYGFLIPAGSETFDTLEPDALERQADIRSADDGWGESFNGSAAFESWMTPGPDGPPVSFTYDTMIATLPENQQVFYLRFRMGEPVDIEAYPYLSVRLKVSPELMYFIRPGGLDDLGQEVPIWYESAATDDRVGSGEWETLTVDLKVLAEASETGGVSLTTITIPVIVYNATLPGSIELDWIRIHDAFAPNSADVTTAEELGDHLDNDLDGLVDKQDIDDIHNQYFERPMVFAHYHPWYGSPFSTTGHWAGWYAAQSDYSGSGDEVAPPTGVVYDPDDYVPGYPGRRNIAPGWYPLNFWDYPDYVPPTDGNYQYDIYGGVEQFDSLNPEYKRRQVALASRYGIDGFAADTGGPGSLVEQIKTTLAATLSLNKPFLMTVLYDWYYELAVWGLVEKKDYQIALDMRFMLAEYGNHPNWWHYHDRPVLTAPFLSHLVAASKWLRIAQIVVDPSISDFEGAIEMPERHDGYGNVAILTFAKAEQPPSSDPRYLSARFKYIEYLDADLNRIAYMDIGQPDLYSHLLVGWSGNEGDPDAPDDQTWVWTAGIEREASIELDIPAEAKYINFFCYSLMADNSMTVSINGSQPIEIPLKTSATSYVCRLRDAGDPVVDPVQATIPDEWPFALFMDHRTAVKYFDGYASYGGYIRANREIISEIGPTILTVGVGYDDRKIRVPGSFTDREDGALYRRNWENALALQPDMVFINTWNEWLESTNIEPTVEFGFKYLELTLTYSLIFKQKMVTSDQPSAMGLTVCRYDVDNNGNVRIRLTSEQSGQLTFNELPLEKTLPEGWVVTRNGESYAQYTLDVDNGSLALTLDDAGDYEILSAASNAIGHMDIWLSIP